MTEIKQLVNVPSETARDSIGCVLINFTLLVALEYIFCQRPWSKLYDMLLLWKPHKVNEKEGVVFWGEGLWVWMPDKAVTISKTLEFGAASC